MGTYHRRALQRLEQYLKLCLRHQMILLRSFEVDVDLRRVGNQGIRIHDGVEFPTSFALHLQRL